MAVLALASYLVVLHWQSWLTLSGDNAELLLLGRSALAGKVQGSRYPLGYPMLAAALWRCGLWAPKLLSALSYLTVVSILRRRCGWLAGLTVALSPALLDLSSSILADAPLALCLVAGVCLPGRWGRLSLAVGVWIKAAAWPVVGAVLVVDVVDAYQSRDWYGWYPLWERWRWAGVVLGAALAVEGWRPADPGTGYAAQWAAADPYQPAAGATGAMDVLRRLWAARTYLAAAPALVLTPWALYWTRGRRFALGKPPADESRPAGWDPINPPSARALIQTPPTPVSHGTSPLWEKNTHPLEWSLGDAGNTRRCGLDVSEIWARWAALAALSLPVAVWPWTASRLLGPVVALWAAAAAPVLQAAVEGRGGVGGWRRWALAGAVAITLAVPARAALDGRWAVFPRWWDEYRQAGEWIREHGGEGVRVVCRKPHWMAVVSGADCRRWPLGVDAEGCARWMDQWDADYAVLEGLGYPSTHGVLLPALQLRRDGWRVAWAAPGDVTMVVERTGGRR